MFYIRQFGIRNLPRWNTFLSTRSLWRSCSLQHQESQQDPERREQQKIYELRVYTVKPGKLHEYVALSAENLHLRISLSKLIGFWKAEISGLNQVVHMWEFDSLVHRTNVRSKMATNPTWVSHFLPRAEAMFQRMDNSIMTLIPGIDVDTPTEKGVYELQNLKLQGHPGSWAQHLTDYVRACKVIQLGPTRLIGAWQSVIGPRQMATLLWQHPNPDSCLSLHQAINSLDESVVLSNHIVGGHSRILLPHPVSPLQ